MGRAAVRTLLEAMRDPGWKPERVELPTRLIVRASSAAPARAAANA
jgi:DNA-binding LacI/PurR family transcriptional regulator